MAALMGIGARSAQSPYLTKSNSDPRTSSTNLEGHNGPKVHHFVASGHVKGIVGFTVLQAELQVIGSAEER